MCNNNTTIPTIALSNPTSRDSFEWDGTKITKFIGEETDVVIPDGTTVIKGNAFNGCSSLTSVVIPEGVKEIGNRAFDDCQKLTIYAPAGSKAEEYAKEKNIPFQVK